VFLLKVGIFSVLDSKLRVILSRIDKIIDFCLEARKLIGEEGACINVFCYRKSETFK
jgi:hypothetical protein